LRTVGFVRQSRVSLPCLIALAYIEVVGLISQVMRYLPESARV